MFWKWLIKLLARLEYGVYIYCQHKQRQAESEGKTELAKALSLHAAQELGHHNILKSLIDSEHKKTYAAKGYSAYVHGHPTNYQVSGDSFLAPEGISRRYLISRIAFEGGKAKELDWPNSLAMMAVGESLARKFYRALSAFVLTPSDYWPAFADIANDEADHCAQLIDHLTRAVSPEQVYELTEQWRKRAKKALLFLPLEPGYQLLRRLRLIW